MNYKILPTHTFEKKIKRLIKKFPSLKKEYQNLITELKTNPTLGTALGNDCYKIRLAISSKNKGKSGGARVITYLVINDIAVYLLTIYDKSEQSNITDKELKAMIKELN